MIQLIGWIISLAAIAMMIVFALLRSETAKRNFKLRTAILWMVIATAGAILNMGWVIALPVIFSLLDARIWLKSTQS